MTEFGCLAGFAGFHLKLCVIGCNLFELYNFNILSQACLLRARKNLLWVTKTYIPISSNDIK